MYIISLRIPDLLKPITVLFLQSVSLWVGNCFYNFITFKARVYLGRTDRILPRACSGSELMGEETIELPWIFHRERRSCSRIISKELLLSSYSFLWLLHVAFHLFFFCEIAPNMSAKWTASLLNRSFC